ncbi:MAG TPA: hypothetical protein DCZ56_01560 [Sutterella sp.]|nr:hypothetical protein [Sutterella sp.]
MTLSRRLFIAGSGLCLLRPSLALSEQNEWTPYHRRPEVQAWAEIVAAENPELSVAWILEALSRARYAGRTERIMKKPALTASPKPRNWLAHKQVFVNAERIYRGRRFIEQYAPTLRYAAERWQVPAPIIASIIGIETTFGKNMGRYRVIDTLSTLSFDYTRRSAYFRDELCALLKICIRRGLAPHKIYGSFAGAIGLCQFMPTNILKLGVDLDQDGLVNLRTSAPDAIGSVANFLHHYGWDKKLPVVWECETNMATAMRLGCCSATLTTTLQNALDAGVRVAEPMNAPPETAVMVVDLPIELPMEKRDTLWRLGTVNFAALLQYNRAFFYAESVRELALALSGDSAEV